MSNNKNGFWDVFKKIVVPAAVAVTAAVIHPKAKKAITQIINENVDKHFKATITAIEQALKNSRRWSIFYLSITAMLVVINVMLSLFTSLHLSLWLYYLTFIPLVASIIQLFVSYFNITKGPDGAKIASYAHSFNQKTPYAYSQVSDIMEFSLHKNLLNPLYVTTSGFVFTVIDQIYQQEEKLQLAHHVGETLMLIDSKEILEQKIIKANGSNIKTVVNKVCKFVGLWLLLAAGNISLKFWLAIDAPLMLLFIPLMLNTILFIYIALMTVSRYKAPFKEQTVNKWLFDLLAGCFRYTKRANGKHELVK